MTASSIDLAEAKRQAQHGDDDARATLASRTDLPPELLYFLARDRATTVRRAAAANPTLPDKASRLLAEDEEPEVRRAVASKLAQRWQPTANSLHRRTLIQLGRDDVLRVRHAIAEALKDSNEAPYELIADLARDTAALVAQPVLEFSPLLSEQDLVGLIAAGAGDDHLSAIARRRDLGTVVSDALVESGCVAAITHLLSNNRAQIREATIDRLIDGAAAVPSWQQALVNRDGLSYDATLRLAAVLADHLLSRLVARHEHDLRMSADLQAALGKRLQEFMLGPSGNRGDDRRLLEMRKTQLREQRDAGQLDDTAVLAALLSQDRHFVVAALSLLAGLPLTTVLGIASSQSGKTLCALAWKAGLHPTTAVELQRRLGRLPEVDILNPTVDGDYPLSVTTMDWQISLFDTEKPPPQDRQPTPSAGINLTGRAIGGNR